MKYKKIKINNSLADEFRKCPAKANFKYILELSKSGVPTKGTPLTLGADIGTVFHSGMEAYHQGEDIGKVVDAMHTQLELPEEGRGCLEHIDLMLTKAMEKWPPGSPFLIEEVLEKPLSRKADGRGRIDLCEKHSGKIVLVDYKTSSNITQYVEKKLPFSNQFSVYLGLLQEHYENVSLDFIVRACQSHEKYVRVKEYQGSRTQEQINAALDWLRITGEEILDNVNKGHFIANRGDRCFDYNRVCQYNDICSQPDRLISDFIKGKEYFINNSDYDGFILE